MGSLMMQGANVRGLRTRVMAMIKGVEVRFGFCPRAKFVCPDHLLHFMIHFLLRVDKLCFFFSFSCINLRGIVLALTQSVDKGKGRLTPCGPNGQMWTRMGNMVNGVIMSRGE